MTDAELGHAIQKPTATINRRIGQAEAHDRRAHELRFIAQQDFVENIAYYYEAKQRLLNPGYRSDLNGGKNRSVEENLRNFGAADWSSFVASCKAYSLQHCDRKLRSFAKANGLLTDDGRNLDDVGSSDLSDENDGEKCRTARRRPDLIAQKRYEYIATAAISIAHGDPENPVSKQIMAAAEYTPAPLTPVSQDLYTELISFVTAAAQIVARVSDDQPVRALLGPLGNVKQLLSKLWLHRPAQEPAKLFAEAKEELRKRNKRLAAKNAQPLGSASYTVLTSEHVQQLGFNPEHETTQTAKESPAEKELPAGPGRVERTNAMHNVIADALLANPDMGHRAIARLFGVSRTTVHRVATVRGIVQNTRPFRRERI